MKCKHEKPSSSDWQRHSCCCPLYLVNVLQSVHHGTAAQTIVKQLIAFVNNYFVTKIPQQAIASTP
jgi:hypothetical protein